MISTNYDSNEQIREIPVTKKPYVASETEVLASEGTNTLRRSSRSLTKVEAARSYKVMSASTQIPFEDIT